MWETQNGLRRQYTTNRISIQAMTAPIIRNMDFFLVNVSEMADIKLAYWVLHDQNFPTYLLPINRCDDVKTVSGRFLK